MLHTIETEIKLFCAQFGENPPVNITYDKTIIRAGKNGHLWFTGHKWDYKGEPYGVVYAGTWRDPSLNQKFTSWESHQKMPKNFYAKAQAEQAVLEAKLAREKEEKHQNCVNKFKPLFDKAKKNTHPYLEKKGILPFNSRVSESGALMYALGKSPTDFTGVQQIYQDADKKFKKKFSFGIDLKGSHHTFKDYRGAEYIFLGEGCATMASAQQAMPNTPCVAAMSASNMFSVIENIRELNPNCKIIILADDDASGVGKKYARICQLRFKNVIYKLPKFAHPNANLSDFNDLHMADGIEALKKQLYIKPAAFYSIIPLGVNENMYFYTTSENPQIVSLKAESHTKAGLRRLCANSDFWKANYGVEKDGDTIPSYDLAASDLMERCHQKGVYLTSLVRGTGIFPEKSDTGETHYVVNNGSNAYSQPDNSRYYYIKKPPFKYQKGDHTPCLSFMGVLAGLPTKTKIGSLYLAAAYVQSFIFPVLPWRFHLWLTGERGSGKSTVLDFIKRSGHFIDLVQDTSAAGLRQGYGSDQTCILYDEAEPSNKKIPDIIDMARESSSNSGAKFLRGTTGGKAIQHNSQLNFIMSSIQIPNMSAADTSRFLFVELVRNRKQTKREFKDMQEFVNLAERHSLYFFYFLSQNVPFILAAREFARDELLDLKIEARQADQLSTVIACLSVVGIGEGTPKETVAMIMRDHDWVNTDYIDESNVSDSENAIDELMELVIDFKSNLTVARAVSNVKCEPNHHGNYLDSKAALESFGLKYIEKHNALFIYHRNNRLTSALKKYPNFAEILHRDGRFNTKKHAVQKLGNRSLRGYLLCLKNVLD